MGLKKVGEVVILVCGLISLGPTHGDEMALKWCLESRQALYPQNQTSCARDMPPGYQPFICVPAVWGGFSRGRKACLWHYFPRCQRQKGLDRDSSPWRRGQRCWVRQAPWQARADLGDLSSRAPERRVWLRDPGALFPKWLLSFPFDLAVHGAFGRTRSDLSCTCVFVYSLKAQLKPYTQARWSPVGRRASNSLKGCVEYKLTCLQPTFFKVVYGKDSTLQVSLSK